MEDPGRDLYQSLIPSPVPDCDGSPVLVFQELKKASRDARGPPCLPEASDLPSVPVEDKRASQTPVPEQGFHLFQTFLVHVEGSDSV